MSQREVNAIAGRLSLRAPQTESLAKLANAIEDAPATRSSTTATLRKCRRY